MFKLGFTTICIGTALGMCSYCAYKYHLDEEVAQIEYRTFHKSTDDIYPQASLCFRDPFSKAKLLKHQINESAYLKYLKGERVMGDFSDVSYNNITIDLSEYVVEGFAMWQNGSSVTQAIDQFRNVTYEISYNGIIRNWFAKCFAITIFHDENTITFSLLIKNSIFPNNTRPMNYGFSIFFHYPKQFLTSYQTIRYTWDSQEEKNGETYSMRFYINEIEAHKQRHKQDKPCNEEWRHYDDKLLENHLVQVGCQTPYQKSKNALPTCKSESKMKEAQLPPSPGVLSNYPPPCSMLEAVRYTYQESSLSDTTWGGRGHFWVTFHTANRRYKMIVQTRYH